MTISSDPIAPTDLLIAGDWVAGEAAPAPVHDKYTGETIAEVAQASTAQVQQAVAAAHARAVEGPLPPYRRYEILSEASHRLSERVETFANRIVAETGFTIAEATMEVGRCVQTLLLSAEEAKRLTGDVVPMDAAPGSAGRIGFTVRRPVGVVAAITPFNSPLNTVAHKVGPALAAGNAVVLKPAEQTPLSAAALCELLQESGLPPGWLNLVQGDGETAGTALLDDPRVDFYTFTGSTQVGRIIQRAAGLRRTQLELGSVSCTIVCADAPPAVAVQRAVGAAFKKAGQVCTSLQRLYVERPLVEEVTERLAAAVAGKRAGDPRDPSSFSGPLISAAEGERVEGWITAATRAGARLVTGGERDGALMNPAVLADVPGDARVLTDELFGPVVNVIGFDRLEDATRDVNALPYGLAAGIFTRDIDRALRTALALRVGGVHINETSSSRLDLMPYGGVKASGFGHEGPAYAAREMTEERLVTISLLPEEA